MQHLTLVLVLIVQTVLCGRYTPPSDPREYDFPYTQRVPVVDEMIRDANFDYELHRVITDDGHILSLHHLVPKNPSPDRSGIPVLFVNGFCFHSEGWMGLGRNTSIAYILSDLGYDVWLGDQRGTVRSVGHVNYSLDDPRTYKYSFHEMGIYDLPAFIDYILNATEHDRLFYVGLSLGSGVFTIMEAEVPEMKSKVIGAVLLGPAMHLSNWKKESIYYYTLLRGFDAMIEAQIKNKQWLLLANQPFLKGAVSSCSYVPFRIYLSSCLTLIGFSFGKYTGNMDAGSGGMQMASVVTSTSVFVGKHLFQVLKTGTFSKYDFGSRKLNKEVYGTSTPPKYDLTKVTTPLLVMYGTTDQMASVEAVERSIRDMISAPMRPKLLKNFNHVDYLFGRQAPKLVYVDIVDFFDRLSSDVSDNSVH